ncbi:MAG TPA: Fic family protein [Myxococcota bacterium]|nr:Fic family protein [Myxococcota bacterium]
MKRTTGQYERTAVGGETVEAFVPHRLPPAPPVEITGPLAERLRSAEQALGRLELAGAMVPSIDWFLYAFVRKEAVVSSQIEGTQATLVDLLRFETGDATDPGPDVEEVCNYVEALRFAREQLSATGGLPLSLRLLNETHRRLMHGVRGADKQPGEVRRSQNWIGGSRPGNAVFVPPPPHLLPDLLGAFERYLHEENADLPPLVRAGLVHVQFETIHPYLDGNGRIGRLLITLALEHWKALAQPLLYLSLFFKRHRGEYYRRLSAVRSEGDWEGWLDFFLEGVATIAEEAVASARELFALVGADRARILAASALSVAAVRLFEALPRHPIVTVSSAMKILDASKPTAGRAIEALVAGGVLVETTGKRRDRWFAYQVYLDRLRAGTELAAGDA